MIQEILFLLIDSVIEAGECLICLSRQLTCIGKKKNAAPSSFNVLFVLFILFVFSTFY